MFGRTGDQSPAVQSRHSAKSSRDGRSELPTDRFENEGQSGGLSMHPCTLGTLLEHHSAASRSRRQLFANKHIARCEPPLQGLMSCMHGMGHGCLVELCACRFSRPRETSEAL